MKTETNNNRSDKSAEDRRAFLGRAAKVAITAPAVALLLDASQAMAANCYVGQKVNNPNCP